MEKGDGLAGTAGPDVAVVGPCSAGKSTLIAQLKEAGYAARAISQEHSYVPYMWQMNHPDVLIFLDLTLETLRSRRKPNWTADLLDEQKRRLAHARQHCDLYISTDELTPQQVADQAMAFLDSFDPSTRTPPDDPELLRLIHHD